MELVVGANLKDLLREGPLPPERAFDVSVQLAEGLHAVHEQGIIHRDFKPANVMIDGRGVVKLMDFGIAKEAGSDRSSPTVSGHVLGTPEYMSPEQARGAVDYRSDIYSLGCVLYEVFSGRAPLKGETPAATILNHLNEPPRLEGDAAASIPPSVRPVLRRAMAKDPAARFASAAELAGALREARVQAGVEAPPAALPPPAVSGPPGAATGQFETATLWRPRDRAPLTWAWSAAAAVMAAVVTLLLTVPRTSTGPATSPAPGVLAAPSVPSSSPPAPSAPNRAETRPEPSVPAVEPGRLTLLVVPPAEVTIDGSSVGVVSLRHLSLAPGAHILRVLHPDYQPLQRKVSVQSGLESKLVLDLAEKAIPRSP
jgi:serine/threonine-protein kinase